MRVSTTVDVVKGQYHIGYKAGAAMFGASMEEDENGTRRLLYADPDGDEGLLLVLPGLFDGDIGLTVETGDDLSAQTDAGWEVVEQTDITGQGEDLRVWILFGGTAELPPIPLPAGRRYRLVLHARGVTEAVDVHMLEPGAAPVEHHLIQLVPI